jgi:hypothetical protein
MISNPPERLAEDFLRDFSEKIFFLFQKLRVIGILFVTLQALKVRFFRKWAYNL